MNKRIGTFVFALVALALVPALSATAQSDAKYQHCISWAQQQTGYYGDNNSYTNNKAPLRGAAAGAAGGAFFGGVTGGNAGTGAAIGAAFGAIAGGVKRREASKKEQSAQQNFYDAMNTCMSH